MLHFTHIQSPYSYSRIILANTSTCTFINKLVPPRFLFAVALSPPRPLILPPTCLPSRSLAPTIALARVSTRSWRHPFDRMYFIDEDGHEKPTAESLEALSTIVMFRSGVWFMAIIDMGFKFTIVSFLGVLFQDNQVAGTCVAWLCCASIMAFFAFQRPYVK